ncbi:MAG: phage holin family protein [Armatimonadota bacterium]
MKRLFWHWAISAIALVFAVAVVQPGIKFERGWYDAIWIAPLLGLINLAVGFVASILKLFFGLANLLTLGILGFIVSFLLYVIAIYWLGHPPTGPLAEVFSVQGIFDAGKLAVIMALFSTVLNIILPGKKDRK